MKPARILLLAPLLAAPKGAPADDPWVVYAGGDGPGAGKHVVLVAGDEEYRSEEALPMLAKILAVRHGFRCTVLFSTDPDDGTIDPDEQTNIPGLEVVDTADMLVLFLRFRELPDEDMKHVVDYVASGKPLLGIRTSTHAFAYSRDRESPYAAWDWQSQTWPGGFGKQVLGETWVAHHGAHGSQSTRGVIEPANADHPILRGVEDVWGPTDVYGIRELPEDARVLLRGRVLAGMEPDSPALEGAENDPMMPLVWLREFTWPTDVGFPCGWLNEQGNRARVVCSTIGASVDCESEGLRRLFVNAVYWGVGLDVPEKSDVDYVGAYEPTFFGFGKHVKGVRAADHRLE